MLHTRKTKQGIDSHLLISMGCSATPRKGGMENPFGQTGSAVPDVSPPKSWGQKRPWPLCSAVKNKNLVQLSARISAQIQSTATMKKINPTPARSTRNRLSFYASGLLVAGTELTEQETKVLSFLPTKQIQRGCEEHKLPPHCSSNVPQPRPESKSLREKAFVKFLFQLIWQLCWDSLQKY